MLIIRSIILLALSIICTSCNKMSFQDDSKLLKLISYNIKVFDKDSILNFKIILKNSSNQDILIPITYWFYDGRISSRFTAFASPDHPFLINTISFFPLNSNLKEALMNVWGRKELEHYPLFIKIRNNDYKEIDIYLSKYFYSTNTNRNCRIYLDSNEYNFLIKLSIISESNIEQLISHRLIESKLISNNNNIYIPIRKTFDNSYDTDSSKIKIKTKEESDILNKLGENKYDVTFKSKIYY